MEREEVVEVRQRDAERTKREIIKAARAEFAETGLAGTSLDAIARAAGVDKRLIYYYFEDKAGLFVAVIGDIVGGIREAEKHLKLTEMDPVDAIRVLIQFSWDYYLEHPDFIRLINSENLYRAEHMARLEHVHEMNQSLVHVLGEILERGRASGVFRGGVDPVQLYVSIVGLTYYYVSNQHTLSLMFKRDLMTPRAQAERLSHVTDVIMGYLLRDY
ncbi:AcrR family transcriptional regulator OS=Castellaniella defragrans OX=75697 GN=HNR28_003414 PE=4 SV=1 [Castellaniella defragrans]